MGIRLPLFVAAALLLSSSLAAQGATQVLGNWTVKAPDAAYLRGGSLPASNSLNTTPGPLTVTEAFSGLAADDDGWANISAWTNIEVEYSGGVLNVPGPDLLMLDVVPDYGQYLISTDYDSFTATTTIDFNTTSPVVSTRTLHQGLSGSSWQLDIAAVEIDLSDIGVPANAVVNNIRFKANSTSCDPMGLVAIVGSTVQPTLVIAPPILTAGGIAAFDVSHVANGNRVAIAYSISGPGPTALNNSQCNGTLVALGMPIKLAGVLTMPNVMTAPIPANAQFLVVRFQGLVLQTCELTNVVTRSIQ